MQWLNEPADWSRDGDVITVTAAPNTDFWRVTHDHGVRHNGHFYYLRVEGDFVAEVKFSGAYNTLYDQAGLMVALDQENWIKCGVEYYNGQQHASVVVTRAFSDWSILPLAGDPSALWLRVTRHDNAVEVAYSLDGESYTMLRQGYFPPGPAAQVGVMVCAPTGDGFTARFEGFTVRAVEG